MKEQLTAGSGERQVAKLVEHHEVKSGELVGQVDRFIKRAGQPDAGVQAVGSTMWWSAMIRSAG